MNSLISRAENVITQPNLSITKYIAKNSAGTQNDYYSNGDYWWPDPNSENGLPYIKLDGQSNPELFCEHRLVLRALSQDISDLVIAYEQTKDEKYSRKAVDMLITFFVDISTRMNPNMLYAQAIPGVCDGRSIGIIDTLHIIDIPFAVLELKRQNQIEPIIYEKITEWFNSFAEWLINHPYGKEEQNHHNNHSITYFVQLAAYSCLTGNLELIDFCRDAYKNNLLPNQMAQNGSFPHELNRTKPFSYSIFALDNMVTLCTILSSEKDNLWKFTTIDGKNIDKGIQFLVPYLKNKATWPYEKDIEEYDFWPTKQSFLLFASENLNNEDCLNLWNNLPLELNNMEVMRNIAIKQPMLYEYWNKYRKKEI